MALTPYEIPLSSQAQRFDITLGNVDYTLRLVWNSISNAWTVDISDGSGNLLVGAIPLITGADLLAQYQYLGFPGGLVCTTDSGEGIPDYAGLGTTGHLYFVTN